MTDRLLITNVSIARMNAKDSGYGQLCDGALLIDGDRIGWVEREEVGIPWLDTVEHMLVKFGESRTSSFSGLIIEEYNNPDWSPEPGQRSG